jgi:hypothetical protein
LIREAAVSKPGCGGGLLGILAIAALRTLCTSALVISGADALALRFAAAVGVFFAGGIAAGQGS